MSSPASSLSSSKRSSSYSPIDDFTTSLSLDSVSVITEKSLIVGETSTDTEDTSDVAISDASYDSEPDSSAAISSLMETVTMDPKIASDECIFTVTVQTENEADAGADVIVVEKPAVDAPKDAETLADVQDVIVANVTESDATKPDVLSTIPTPVDVSPTLAPFRKIMINKADLPIKTVENAINESMDSVEIDFSTDLGIIEMGTDPLAKLRSKLEPTEAEDDNPDVSTFLRRDLSPVAEPKNVLSEESEDDSFPYGFLPSDEEGLAKWVKKICCKPSPYEKVSPRYAKAMLKKAEMLKAAGFKIEETIPAAEETNSLSDYDPRENPSSDEDDYSSDASHGITAVRTKGSYRLLEPKPLLEPKQPEESSFSVQLPRPSALANRRGHRDYQSPAATSRSVSTSSETASSADSYSGGFPPYNDAYEESYRQWQAWYWQQQQAQAAVANCGYYYGPPSGEYQNHGSYHQQNQAPHSTRPYHLDHNARISQYYPESRGHRTGPAPWSRYPPPPPNVGLGEMDGGVDSFNGPYYPGSSYRGYCQQPQGGQRGNYSNRCSGRGSAFNDQLHGQSQLQKRDLGGRYGEIRGRQMTGGGGQRASSFIQSHAINSKSTKKSEERATDLQSSGGGAQWYDFDNSPSTGSVRLDPRPSGSTRGGPSGRGLRGNGRSARYSDRQRSSKQ